MRSLLALATLALALTSCSGVAHDYGYSRRYTPSADEQSRVSDCRADLAPANICEDFARWHGTRFSWFGVITQLDPARSGAEDGWVILRLSHRAHVEPHRCTDATDETSCRVTVDVRDGGTFAAKVQLQQDDWTGPLRVRVGSLVRVVGSMSLDGCHGDDGPMLDATWYRHWPHGFYATSSGGDHVPGT